MKSYEFRHIVCFEETNLVGNVYYVNHIRWQGKCREMFLHDHASSLLADIETGNFALVTLKCACEYFEEIKAFEEIIVRMSLKSVQQNRISMHFDYYKRVDQYEKLIAIGEQTVACMERRNGSYIATTVPKDLQFALLNYLEMNS